MSCLFTPDAHLKAHIIKYKRILIDRMNIVVVGGGGVEDQGRGTVRMEYSSRLCIRLSFRSLMPWNVSGYATHPRLRQKEPEGQPRGGNVKTGKRDERWAAR